jgi:hypothetical protein
MKRKTLISVFLLTFCLVAFSGVYAEPLQTPHGNRMGSWTVPVKKEDVVQYDFTKLELFNLIKQKRESLELYFGSKVTLVVIIKVTCKSCIKTITNLTETTLGYPPDKVQVILLPSPRNNAWVNIRAWDEYRWHFPTFLMRLDEWEKMFQELELDGVITVPYTLIFKDGVYQKGYDLEEFMWEIPRGEQKMKEFLEDE